MNQERAAAKGGGRLHQPRQRPARGPFDGVWNILRFNWPFYAAGLAVCLAGILLLEFVHWPFLLQLLGSMGVGVALFWLIASLVVSFYVYDLSPLYRWRWLKPLFSEQPGNWVNIHSGFDETSLLLQKLFPGGTMQVLDIYDAEKMTEPSIARARALVPPPVPATVASCAQLPLDNDSLDTVFLIFAAHEVRSPEDRLHFFRELKRVTQPGGVIVIVEHLRDAANFLAFGPGFWHFLPRNEWRRLACKSGFDIQDEFRVTPFVGVFILRNASPEPAC